MIKEKKVVLELTKKFLKSQLSTITRFLLRTENVIFFFSKNAFFQALGSPKKPPSGPIVSITHVYPGMSSILKKNYG